MNRSVVGQLGRKWVRHLAAGWMGAMGWVNAGQAALTDEPGAAPQITVYVYNWAEVEPSTMREARDDAARLFRNAGLDARVIDPPLSADNGQRGAAEEVNAASFIVHVVPPAMAKKFRLPATMLGVAPGTPQEKNRTTVYVFDQAAARMAREHQEQVLARVNGSAPRAVGKGQVLGYAMAHEIGHVLLHSESHSRSGIMQAHWDRDALADVVTGRMNFSPDEAARIRAEAARRGIRQ